MPLYEYKCHGCGKRFEVIQKFSDEPLRTHPECGGEAERLLSPPALQFKGSGWYITDYARNNGASKPEGKTEGKTESADNGKKSGSESAASEKNAAPASTSKAPEAKPASTSSSSSSTPPSGSK